MKWPKDKLTRFEVARIIGARSLQITLGAPILVKVEIAKKKPRGALTHGERAFNRKLAGYGSFPRPNPKGREKSTRRLDLRFKCKTCNKKFVSGKGFRVKKFNIQR